MFWSHLLARSDRGGVSPHASRNILCAKLHKRERVRLRNEQSPVFGAMRAFPPRVDRPHRSEALAESKMKWGLARSRPGCARRPREGGRAASSERGPGAQVARGRPALYPRLLAARWPGGARGGTRRARTNEATRTGKGRVRSYFTFR